MEQRLSIVTLGVDDLQRARAFYEALGWRVASEELADSIVCFTLNGIGFALYPRKKLIEDIGPGPAAARRPARSPWPTTFAGARTSPKCSTKPNAQAA